MKWFLNLSTRAKIVSGFGAMFVLLAIVTATAFTSISAIRTSQEEMIHGDVQTALHLAELRADQNRTRAQMLEMVMTRERARQQALEQDIKTRSADIDQQLKELREFYRNEPKSLARLQELETIRTAYGKTREEQFSLIGRGKNDEARQFGVGIQDERYNRIRTIAMELGTQEVGHAEQRIGQSRERARNATIVFLVIGAAAFLLGVGMTTSLTRAIAAPLTEISLVAERVAVGELEVTIPSADRKDEVGALAQAFRRMVENISGMAGATKRIAAGDLSVRISPQSERDVMGNALSTMVDGLRAMTMEMIEGINVIAAAASEIMASSNQVATGATETAAAMSETTSTVEEVKQTAQLASAKAQSVSAVAQSAVQVALGGRRAVEESVAGMGRIQEQVTSIAESIVRLSEQSQTIGEIIATVNDLAEQSNILAVNAAIEAAKAGEQGKGFAVVAQEVKSLAEQSKEATAQVRTILSDIQRATNAAVLATEQGSKAVEAGGRQSREAGEAIRQMGESIETSAQAALQIAASSQQQLAGMDQVALAMENIRQASEQNVAGTRQVEAAVQNLHELGQKLKILVEQFKV